MVSSIKSRAAGHRHPAFAELLQKDAALGIIFTLLLLREGQGLLNIEIYSPFNLIEVFLCILNVCVPKKSNFTFPDKVLFRMPPIECEYMPIIFKRRYLDMSGPQRQQLPDESRQIIIAELSLKMTVHDPANALVFHIRIAAPIAPIFFQVHVVF